MVPAKSLKIQSGLCWKEKGRMMTSAVPKAVITAAKKRLTLFNLTSSKNKTGRKMIPCGFIRTAAAKRAADKHTFFSDSMNNARTTIRVKNESTCPQKVEL